MRKHPAIRRQVLLLAFLAAPIACLAQFKCVGSDGKVSFQQMPCADSATSRPLRGDSAAAQPAGKGHWAAIARGVPEVGMTRAELDSAAGRPDKTSSAQNDAGSDETLTYNKPDKTYEVTVHNGVVSAVSAKDPETTTTTKTTAAEPGRSPSCLSPAQIRDLEFEASKIVNRNNYALRAQINQAKACR